VADDSSGLVIYPSGSSTPRATLSGGVTDVKAPDAVAVSPPLRLAMRELPEAAVGRQYNGRLLAILGQAPLRWRLARGRLPRGLNLGLGGRVMGVPRRAGRSRLAVTVRDAEHPAQTATATVTLIVGRLPVLNSVSPGHGTAAGGATVQITGQNLKAAGQPVTVAFGRLRAPKVTCASAQRCVAVTPPGKPGTVRVTVTVGDLGSARSKRTRYTYRR
jgi:hypothetical protein